MNHFKLICSTKASDIVPVTKYKSQKTGITVIIANVEGPLVNGYFCLATEAHDDDGLPHTLEHLVFLGSESYPYKGILDLLANRCMAQGTNAWTDTDHTCYTIYTAGDAGMLTLLPIYLDHILRPTLTDEGYITEVHHIDGDGEDAGIVYCEMQGRENNADSRMELKLLRAFYPNSGYCSEVGGIMKNFRTTTNNIKVRNFHKKFYRPENLTIILTGQIEAEDVFKAVAIVEDDITAKNQLQSPEEWVKPWQADPPLPIYGELKEQWPADTEDCGQIIFGWRGPVLKETTALEELTACAILLRYLCETATAPLQSHLVEKEDALAGDVSFNIIENLAPLLKITLDNVPINKLERARDEAKACMTAIRSGEEAINMERMKRLVKKQLRESIATLETDAHHTIAFQCIGDALYSNSEEDFVTRLNPQGILRVLLEKPSEYWLNLLQTYFTDDMVIVVGSPSIKLQAMMAEEEKCRIEKQKAELGEAGLSEKRKILKHAVEFNERAPPSGTLASVPLPSHDNLKCHIIKSWSSDGENCPYFDLKEVPIYARVHSLKTNFVYINLLLDLTKVDQQTRKWLPTIINSLGECPIKRGDEIIPHEAVISTTEQLTVVFNNNIGFNRQGNFSVGQFGNFVHIEARCEPSDYLDVVNHLYEILYTADITKERLLVFLQRLINDISQVRRKGDKMVYHTLRDALYSKDSNMHWCSVLRQQKFLKDLMERLSAGGDCSECILREAQESYRKICEPVWLHLAADLERHTLSTKPWSKFAKRNEIIPLQPQLYWDAELMSGWGGGFVIGIGGLESSFLVQLSPGPLTYDLSDIAPLLVALKYFTQLEGPMWKMIRGCGLSYGYGIRSDPNEGRLSFTLYKSTNVIAAYSKAKSMVEEYLSGGKFDDDLFASAKSSALFDVVENEKSPADVVSQSLLNYFKRIAHSYNRDLLCAVATSTPEKAHEAAVRWLPSILDIKQSKLSVVCHPCKVNDTQAAFEKIGINLEAFESMESSHFNK